MLVGLALGAEHAGREPEVGGVEGRRALIAARNRVHEAIRHEVLLTLVAAIPIQGVEPVQARSHVVSRVGSRDRSALHDTLGAVLVGELVHQPVAFLAGR